MTRRCHTSYGEACPHHPLPAVYRAKNGGQPTIMDWATVSIVRRGGPVAALDSVFAADGSGGSRRRACPRSRRGVHTSRRRRWLSHASVCARRCRQKHVRTAASALGMYAGCRTDHLTAIKALYNMCSDISRATEYRLKKVCEPSRSTRTGWEDWSSQDGVAGSRDGTVSARGMWCWDGRGRE